MDDRVFHPYPNARRAFFNDNRPEVCELTGRGESLAAFDRRCIPAPPQRGCRVGDPWRLAGLGATPDFHHGLVTKLRLKPPSDDPSASEPSLLDAAADARAKTVAFFCGGLKA